MESYLQSLLKGFIEAQDEVHVHTYEVDRKVAARFPLILHRKSLFFFPSRYRKLYFLAYCNRYFQRNEYDLSLSLTRTACQDIAIIGGLHSASLASRKRSNWYRAIYDRKEVFFEEKMLRNTPGIIAHSFLIEKEILRYYSVDQSRIKVIYPPIDTDRFRPVSGLELEAVRRQFALDERMTLLFPSLDHERKGLDRLIRSFKELNPDRYALLIAGRRPKKNQTLPANVRYIGYIQNLAGLYSAVDYVVLPSIYEPFGLVVTESLQCGTPVVLTSQVGAAELLRPDDGILLDDKHPESIADVIVGLKRKRIKPGFARSRGLEISQHISALKSFALERKERVLLE